MSLPQSSFGARDAVAECAQVRFDTAGKTYRVEYSDDLSTRKWSVLVEKIAGDGAPVIVLDPAAAHLPQRFHRLRVTQPLGR